jgi:putative heme-binding domain-containing protein
VQGDPETRLAAARALITCNGDPAPVVAAIGDAASPVALREQLAAAVGERPDAAASLVPALKAAPHLVQKAIALAMAGSQRGCGTLLDAVSAGQASATLLRDKSLADRIRAAGLPGAEDRLAKLTANLPPANEQTEKLLAARRAGYHPEKSDVRRGADVFGRNCAVCHRVGTTGALIGPQLDGVGNRGLDRLVEDILDPNRNVDAAFRMQTITRKDGTVLAGLFRRDEGAQVVFADFTGKEFNLPKADIQARNESETSLMPPGMSEIIPEAEFYDLLAFLLSQRATGQPANGLQQSRIRPSGCFRRCPHGGCRSQAGAATHGARRGIRALPTRDNCRTARARASERRRAHCGEDSCNPGCEADR